MTHLMTVTAINVRKTCPIHGYEPKVLKLDKREFCAACVADILASIMSGAELQMVVEEITDGSSERSVACCHCGAQRPDNTEACSKCGKQEEP